VTTVSNNVRTQQVRSTQAEGTGGGPNDILSRYQPTGAGVRTARQDGLQPGVETSRRMAQTDLPKLQNYREPIMAAAQKHGVPPALLAAIASRETRGGSALNSSGYGYNGKDYGLMQVNVDSHPGANRHGAFSAGHIDQAAGILKNMWNQVKKDHPGWPPEQQLRGAVAAYNAGPGNVRTLANMDKGTTGDDYSTDVWARAQALAPHFGGAPGTGAANGSNAPRQATRFPPFDGQYTAAPSLQDVQGGKQNLQIGHKGEAVGQVQDKLMELGYLSREQVGNDRGHFGPKTRAAVDAFQRDKGLTPPAGKEGTVGPTTLGWLQNNGQPPATQPQRPQAPGTTDGFSQGGKQYTPAPSTQDVLSGKGTLRQGMQGEAVKQLQSELVKHGYMTQDQMKTGEGIFGPRTKAAVDAFQQDRGLTPPPGQKGTVGKTTLEALQKAPAANSGGSAGNVNGGDVPVYRQGDARWGSRALGTGSSLSAAGCAMTATAMAISKISGRNIDPGQLDQYLDKNGGYSGNAVRWDVAARAGGLNAQAPGWSLNRIDKELSAGRPVVVGVDYKRGSNGGGNGTDHWVTVTGKRTENGRTVYTANDPANGQRFTFTMDGNRMRATQQDGAWRNYVTTGELRTFSP
jgi:peptidoglycan hydrolase-like protein with peptidoglycan-binding domain